MQQLAQAFDARIGPQWHHPSVEESISQASLISHFQQEQVRNIIGAISEASRETFVVLGFIVERKG